MRRREKALGTRLVKLVKEKLPSLSGALVRAENFLVMLHVAGKQEGNPNHFHVRFSIFMCRRKTPAIFFKKGKISFFFNLNFLVIQNFILAL
jgi:hypothetical protein